MEPAALPDSVRQYLAAPDATSADPAAIAGLIADLMLMARAARDLPGLDQGIEWLGQLLRSAPTRHPQRPRWLSNLAAARHTRFQWSGRPADLEEAVSLGRASVQAAPEGHPERAMCVGNLGAFLGSRFGLAGQSADLDETIA